MSSLRGIKLTPEERLERLQQRERESIDRIRVTRFQAKMALLQAGLLEQVEAYMQGEEIPSEVKLAWSEASFLRDSMLINDLAGEFGLSTEEVDQLFINAQQIRV